MILTNFVTNLFTLYRNEQLPRDFRLKESSFQMTTFTYLEIQEKTDKRLQVSINCDVAFTYNVRIKSLKSL